MGNASVSTCSRRLAAGLVLAAAAALAGLPAAAGAAPSFEGASASDKGSPLSSHLQPLTAARLADASKRRQALAAGVATHGPASFQYAHGKLLVQARVGGTGAATIAGLRDAGAEIAFVSHRYRTVDLAADPADLEAIGAAGGVEYVSELLQPLDNEAGAIETEALRLRRDFCGSVNSEGDTQLRAATARSTYGVDGSGVKVGVVSDSYDADASAATHAAADVASGDLPGAGNPCGHTTPVQNLAEGTASDIDEGRAMAQIVHDLAPGAALAVASRGASEEEMASRIRALSTAGAAVIVDDITFFAEPFFQDGPIAVAVSDVTDAGRTYFSSAANSNAPLGGNNVGSYEATTTRTIGGGTCIPASAGLGCVDFNPTATTDNTFRFTAGPGQFTVNLQWAEPRNGVTTDLDLYLVDANTSAIVDSSTSSNPASGRPFEFVGAANGSGGNYWVVIENFSQSGAAPRLKFIIQRADITGAEYPTALGGGDLIGPSIFGHNGSEDTVSVAAVPYNNSSTLEGFSSFGPVTITHGPVNGASPAPALASPQVLSKPDISATDGNRTTFFLPTGSPGEFRFFGTSAAAPHAAAVAALQKDADPQATPAEIKSAQQASARPVGSFPATGQGAGLLDAAGAVGATITGPNAPAAPTLTGTSPASGADNNSPKIRGNAAAGTTVKVFANATCTGTPAATGSAASFASPGLTVSVADNSTTRFRATATNANGTSACSSSSVTYVERTAAEPPALGFEAAARPKQSAKRLAITARCAHACDVVATAVGKVTKRRKNGKRKKIRFTAKGRASLAADVTTKIKLPLTGRRAAKIAKLPGKAKITAVATDRFGQRSVLTGTVKLKGKR